MDPLVIDEDEGYLPVDLKQPGGLPPLRVYLDLFEASNAYATIHAEHADLVERGGAWVAWLAGKGFPPISHGAAFAVAGRVNDAVADFAKKKVGIVSEGVASRGSTDSPSPE